MNRALLSAACHVYSVSAALYLAYLVRSRPSLATCGLLALIGGFVLHAAGIIESFVTHGLSSIMNLAEGLSFLAWLLVGGFLVMDRRYRLPVIGAFVTPLVLLVVLPSLLLHSNERPLPASFALAGLPVHVVIAFLGIAVFALATGVAVMYVLLERQVKGKRFGVLFSRLPSLEVLDEINSTLVRLGFVALSITLVTGSFFAKEAWGDYWRWDPKQTLSLLGWLLYAALIHARLFIGWRGRRVALLTMVGFGVLFVSFVGLKLFPIGMHHGGLE